MKDQTIGASYLIDDINKLLYDPLTSLSEFVLQHLVNIKNKLKEFEAEVQKMFAALEDNDWEQAILPHQLQCKLDDAYRYTLTALQDIQTSTYAVTSKHALSQGEADIIDKIGKKISAFMQVIVAQQTKQKNYFAQRSQVKSLFAIMKHLRLCVVPSNQSADPLYGGKQRDGDIRSLSGLCAGKVIAWIYQCAEKGSPKYPLYSQTSQHWYQDNQADFKDNAEEIIPVCEINSCFKQLFANITAGEFYYLSIKDTSGGHAIGVRQRYDGVYEIYEPNYGCFLSLTKEKAELALLCIMSVNYQNYDYAWAMVYRAPVKDREPKRQYFPDRVLLSKSALVIRTQEDDKKLIKQITTRLRLMLACLSLDYVVGNARVYQAHVIRTYELVINSIEFSEALQELYKETNKYKSSTATIIEGKIAARLKVINKPEYQQARNERDKLVVDYNEQQKELATRINDVRSAIGALTADAASHKKITVLQRLHGLGARMMQLSRVMTSANRTEFAVTMNFSPIQTVKDFAGKVSRKFKGLLGFGKKEKTEAKPEVLNDISQALAKDKQFDEAQSKLSAADTKQLDKRMQLFKYFAALQKVLPLVMHFNDKNMNAELGRSGLSNYQINQIDILHRAINRKIASIRDKLLEFQDRLFCVDDGKERNSVNEEFSALAFIKHEHLLFLENADYGEESVHAFYKAFKGALSSQELADAEAELLAIKQQNALLAERKNIVTAIDACVEEYQKYAATVTDEYKQSEDKLDVALALYIKLKHAYAKKQILALKKSRYEINKCSLQTDISIAKFRKHVAQLVKVHGKYFTTDFRLQGYLLATIKNEAQAHVQSKFQQCHRQPLLDLFRKLSALCFELAKEAQRYQQSDAQRLKLAVTATDNALTRKVKGAVYEANMSLLRCYQSLEQKLSALLDIEYIAEYCSDHNTYQYMIHVQASLTEFPLTKLNDNNVADFVSSTMDKVWVDYVRPSYLKLILSIKIYLEELRDGGRTYISPQQKLGLFSADEVQQFNQLARRAAFNMLDGYDSLEGFHEIVQFFELNLSANIESQNKTGQALPLRNLAQLFDITVRRKDLQILRENMHSHLDMLLEYLASRSEKVAKTMSEAIKAIKSDYTFSNEISQQGTISPSIGDVVTFVQRVNDVAIVYDPDNYSLCDDYKEQIGGQIHQSCP